MGKRLTVGILLALATLGFMACDLSGLTSEERFELGEDLSYNYSAVDSTGFEVVTGSLKFKFDFTRWGCTSEKCADIKGSWDFVSRITPPIAPHPVGKGSVGGILTNRFQTKMSIGPDNRGNSVILEFPIPPRAEMVGTWTSPSGVGGVARFLEK